MTTIRTAVRHHALATIPIVATIHHGVAVRSGSGAIVSVHKASRGGRIIEQVVTGIELLPFDVAPVVARVSALPDEDPIVIDADQLGRPVWQALGFHPRSTHGRPRFARYDGEGAARYRELLSPLLAGAALPEFTFAPGLGNRDAMRRALADAQRDVARGDDVGSALVVALALAIRSRPPGGARIY